jgi:hypothetical protein
MSIDLVGGGKVENRDSKNRAKRKEWALLGQDGCGYRIHCGGCSDVDVQSQRLWTIPAQSLSDEQKTMWINRCRAGVEQAVDRERRYASNLWVVESCWILPGSQWDPSSPNKSKQTLSDDSSPRGSHVINSTASVVTHQQHRQSVISILL